MEDGADAQAGQLLLTDGAELTPGKPQPGHQCCIVLQFELARDAQDARAVHQLTAILVRALRKVNKVTGFCLV